MKIRENLKLYFKYASICIQSVMEYKLSFFDGCCTVNNSIL